MTEDDLKVSIRWNMIGSLLATLSLVTNVVSILQHRNVFWICVTGFLSFFAAIPALLMIRRAGGVLKAHSIHVFIFFAQSGICLTMFLRATHILP